MAVWLSMAAVATGYPSAAQPSQGTKYGRSTSLAADIFETAPLLQPKQRYSNDSKQTSRDAADLRPLFSIIPKMVPGFQDGCIRFG